MICGLTDGRNRSSLYAIDIIFTRIMEGVYFVYANKYRDRLSASWTALSWVACRHITMPHSQKRTSEARIRVHPHRAACLRTERVHPCLLFRWLDSEDPCSQVTTGTHCGMQHQTLTPRIPMGSATGIGSGRRIAG